MENLIYLIFFIIYVIIAIVKKVSENKAEQKVSSKPTTPTAKHDKDIFGRLAEIHKQQVLEQERTYAQGDTQNIEEQTVPLAKQNMQSDSTSKNIQTADKKVEVSTPVNQYESFNNFSYNDQKREDTPEEITTSFDDFADLTKTKNEIDEDIFSELTESEHNNGIDLQQAFIWKEIFDKPVALRK